MSAAKGPATASGQSPQATWPPGANPAPLPTVHSGSEEKIIHLEGFLEKRGQLNTAWKKRWCRLQNEKITYAKPKDKNKPVNFVPLQQAILRVRNLTWAVTHMSQPAHHSYALMMVAESMLLRLLRKHESISLRQGVEWSWWSGCGR